MISLHNRNIPRIELEDKIIELRQHAENYEYILAAICVEEILKLLYKLRNPKGNK